ncbi:MAG TPA: hypothetical protein VMZ03_13720 [Chitinophagaceae bacterium]|nr:hypothetical protein [Chitinophagaceae bacterium]
MIILQIEHRVPNFDGWKKIFDNDPIGRERSGVKRYRIYRPVDDPNYAIIDLEFDTLNQAETALKALKALWGKMDGSVMTNPKARIVELAESKEY